MRKEYTKPEIMISLFSTEDVITASVTTTTTTAMTMDTGAPIVFSDPAADTTGIPSVDASEVGLD